MKGAFTCLSLSLFCSHTKELITVLSTKDISTITDYKYSLWSQIILIKGQGTTAKKEEKVPLFCAAILSSHFTEKSIVT